MQQAIVYQHGNQFLKGISLPQSSVLQKTDNEEFSPRSYTEFHGERPEQHGVTVWMKNAA
jgi:hypothetical protein